MELDKFKDVDLVLDRANDTFIAKQVVSHGDYLGRTSTVQITNGGLVGALPGAQLVLHWKNMASGLSDDSAYTLIDADNAIFRIEYPQNMLTPGTVKANILVIYQGKTTVSREFEITVANVAGQSTGVLAKAEFSALVAALNKVSQFTDNSPQEVFATLEALKAKYPSGTKGAMVVSADGNWYWWNGTQWTSGGIYQASTLSDESKESLARYIEAQTNQLPSGKITNDTLKNGNVQSFNSALSVVTRMGRQMVLSTNSDGTFTGYQGIELSNTFGATVLKRRKRFKFQYLVENNARLRVQINYKLKNGGFLAKTIGEFFAIGETKIKEFNEIFDPLIRDDIDYSAASIRIVQWGDTDTPRPFLVSDWSLTDSFEENSAIKKIISTRDEGNFDSTKFNQSLATRGTRNFRSFSAKSADNKYFTLNFPVRLPLLNSSSVMSDLFNMLKFDIEALFFYSIQSENSYQNKKVNLKFHILDKNMTVLKERLIASQECYASKTSHTFKHKFVPFQTDLITENAYYFQFLIEVPELLTTETFDLGNFEVLLDERNFEKQKYYLKQELYNANATSSIYTNNQLYRRVLISDISQNNEFGESYYYNLCTFLKDKSIAKIDFYIHNQESYDCQYNVAINMLTQDGTIVDRTVQRTFNVKSYERFDVAMDFDFKGYSQNNILAVRVARVETKATGEQELRFTVPNVEFSRGQKADGSSNLIGNWERSLVPDVPELAENVEIKYGSKWFTISKKYDVVTDYERYFGTGYVAKIYQIDALLKKPLEIKAQLISNQDQTVNIVATWRGKIINGQATYLQDTIIGSLNLKANEATNFEIVFANNKVTTLAELSNYQFLEIGFRGLSKEDGLVNLGISRVEINTRKATSIKDETIPTFNIVGDITLLGERTENVIVEYFDGKESITLYATTKLQGDSSRAFVKKSYRLNFFTDEGRTTKLKLPIIPHAKPVNSLNLKANWIDWTGFNNELVSEQHKIQCLSNNDTYTERLKNNYSQEQCEFFVCNVYINGVYNGLYTCSTKKGDAIDVDTDNPKEVAIQGVAYNNYTGFKVDEAIFDETIDFEIIDGELTDELKASFNGFMKLVNSGTDEEFKVKIADKVNLQSIANVLLVNIMFGNRDCFGKNTVWQTFDGVKWYAVSYDHDLAFGTTSSADVYMTPDLKTIGFIMTNSKLIERLIHTKMLYEPLFQALEKFNQNNTKASLIQAITNKFKERGSYNYIRNHAKWTDQPYTDYYDARDVIEYMNLRYDLVQNWVTNQYLDTL